MPNGVPQTYNVSSANPIPIYPSGGQGMVTVVNSGNHDVILSNEANTLMQMPLASGGSIQWSAGMPLYAFCPPGGTATTVVIFPGAITLAPGKVQIVGDVQANILGPVTAEIDGPVEVTGNVNVGNVVNTEVTNTINAEIANVVTVDGDVTATVTGDVNATITGPVDAEISGPVTVNTILNPIPGISAPVTIQNGSAGILAEYSFPLAAGTFDASALDPLLARFPSYHMRIGIQSASSSADATVTYRLGNFTGYEVRGTLLRLGTTSTSLGATNIHSFSGPNLFGAAPALSVENRGPNDVTLLIQIMGQQNATTAVVTDPPFAWYAAQRASVSIGSASTFYCYIAPSYQSRTFRLILSNAAGTVTDGFVQWYEEADVPPTWRNFSRDVLRMPDGSMVTSPRGYTDITVPGTGVPMRMTFTASGSGADVAITQIA